MTDPRLLAVYDDVLRPYECAAPSADTRHTVGPVTVARYSAGRGFVTYRDLGGLDAAGIAALVDAVVDELVGDPGVVTFEWKTREHDDAPGLVEALTRRGLAPEEPESVMIGPAETLAGAPVPDGVTVRQVHTEEEVRAAEAVASEVFGSTGEESRRIADALVRGVLAADGTMEMWVAEADGEIISSGRLEPVPGTDLAGIWGGSTRADWRRRGVYRALTAARARSGMARGVRYIHSDSTQDSRPILERSGFVRVTGTTPFVWYRS